MELRNGRRTGRKGGEERRGRVEYGFPCRLRKMDFLNIPIKEDQPDATDILDKAERNILECF